MRTYKPLLLLSMIIALMFGCIGCSSEDDPPESTAEYHGTTVNFYGTTIPYEPLDEKELPSWLIEIKNAKSMMGLYRICEGVYNGGVIYNLNSWTDSSLVGLFLDKDGHPVTFECSFEDFIAQVHNVKCIYYKVKHTATLSLNKKEKNFTHPLSYTGSINGKGTDVQISIDPCASTIFL